MKQTFIIYCCLCISIISCSHNHNTIVINTSNWSTKDSVNNTHITLSCSYIKDGQTELKDSINTWLCKVFGDDNCKFKGDIQNMLKTYGQALKNSFLNEKVEFSKTVRVIYEDSDYITLLLNEHCLANDNPGYYGSIGCTFLKIDGHKMGWEFLKNKNRHNLIQEIENGLIKYFEITESSSNTKGELLRDHLLCDKIPLPKSEPYLTDSGIELIYQQNEIACLAEGLPKVTIKR